ncbi:hypothetical protein JX266_002594 [Neoarthrinium moseri]|nr:hypothetical protein JX266_002594 [Neoarthrinium moseri]
MDYHRPLVMGNGHPKVHIALVLSPAPGRTEDPASYAESPLMVNPGGPGGSGTTFVALYNKQLRGAIGGDHDILGFDPRGVGATTPNVNCFESPDTTGSGPNADLFNRFSWVIGGREIGLVNSSDHALAQNAVRAKAVGQLCKLNSDAQGKDSIFHYLNTAHVARDMLSVIQAWDDWKLGSSKRAQAAKAGRHAPVSDPSQHTRMNTDPDTPTHGTQGKLVYWGFSYGTVLGATFARLYPDKVGRVILDGVVDTDGYGEAVWMDSMVDADKILDKFYTYCHEARWRCKLYRQGDEVQDIATRYEQILASLRTEPKIVFIPGFYTPVILTASDVHSAMFAALYNPIGTFPIMAEFLDALWTDQPVWVFVTTPVLWLLCGEVQLPIRPDDSTAAISCSDRVKSGFNETLPQLQYRFEKLAKVSSFADVWLGLNLVCNGWPIEVRQPPDTSNTGPVHESAPINTSFPILVLTNTLDPVTPLRSAMKVNRQFANSSIVEQKTEGHCSLACTSICIIGHIRAYLNEGKLPPAPQLDSPDTGDEKVAFAEPVDYLHEDPIHGDWTRSWGNLRHGFFQQLVGDKLDDRHPLRNLVTGQVLGTEGESMASSRQLR